MPGWDKLIEEGIQPDAARRAAASARVLIAGGADEYAVWASFSGLPTRAHQSRQKRDPRPCWHTGDVSRGMRLL